jgi:hypothetical protein
METGLTPAQAGDNDSDTSVRFAATPSPRIAERGNQRVVVKATGANFLEVEEARKLFQREPDS